VRGLVARSGELGVRMQSVRGDRVCDAWHGGGHRGTQKFTWTSPARVRKRREAVGPKGVTATGVVRGRVGVSRNLQNHIVGKNALGTQGQPALAVASIDQ
jgi:hypothetical protein